MNSCLEDALGGIHITLKVRLGIDHLDAAGLVSEVEKITRDVFACEQF